jgi:PAS domain S-box-containing protein
MEPRSKMLDFFPRPLTSQLSPDFMAGGGEMGERIRGHDWGRTALDAAREWPQGLKAAVRIMLASRQPMSIWWGAELTVLYNDACRALIGGNHPAGLGQPAPAAWREIWEDMGPRVEGAIRGNEQGAAKPVPLLVERHGRVEEAHYTITFTAMPGDANATGGLMCAFTDVSLSVVFDRQMNLLKAVAAHTAGAATLDDACTLAAQGLGQSAADVPFAAIYLVDEQEGTARLAASAGIARGHGAFPETVAIGGECPWPFAEALALGTRPFHPVVLGESTFGPLPSGPWSRPPREAAVARLGSATMDGKRAVLIAALNPFRVLADDARRFIELACAQVAAGISNAQARNEEGRRLEAETLHEVARDIASELDLQQVVQKVTDAGTQLTGARFGAFFYNVTDPEGNAFQLFTLSGAPREAFEKFGMPRATPVFKPTFVGQGPVRVADITKDARYGREGPHYGMPEGHLPVKSYLSVPVISRSGEVLGGLFFGHPDAAVFDARAERNALGIASQASVAIDNANLFGRAKDEIGRRTQMEGELRESEQHSRELVAGLPAAVCTIDAAGRIADYNQAAVDLWGRAPEVGKERWCGSAKVLTPEGVPIDLDHGPMAKAMRGESVPDNFEITIERPDGSYRHALAHPRAIHDGAGNIVGAVNMLVDITPRKAAETELAFTKDQLGLQVESLTKLHQLAMELGGISELEPALQKILDTAVKAQDADHGLVWIHDAESGRLRVAASNGFDAKALELFREVLPGPDGGSAGNAFANRRRWVICDTQADPDFAAFRDAARIVGFRSVHSTPIVTRAGALLGVISVHFRSTRTPLEREMQIADVCARHAADAIEAWRSQEALRESERLYRAIGESMEYGVWTADAQGGNTFLSESFLKLTGLTEKAADGSGWSRAIHPDDVEPLLAKWKACQHDGSKWDHEFRVRGADGNWYAILGRAVPLRNERGAITGWAGINLDIGRLKRVEDELRELDQRKNEFLATLAHELRNPLAPLRNGLEVMRLASGNPDMVEKARAMMERQLSQMVRLVDDLLDVSRVSRGKIELRRGPIELAAVLRNALETSQPLMNERRHQLIAKIPVERIVLDGDMTRLSQVFWNLLNNAAKYTECGGRIELSVQRLAGEVAVSVKDNGVGIPPNMLSRVFDIFTQVDRSLEKSQGGLGIGLSIAKRLVEMHGGTIQVMSEGHLKGSEFVVRLPARIGPASASPGGETGRARGLAGARHRILIADDNADSAATLSIMLEALGNEVRVANDGQEAVEIAEQFRPDAILLDIGMPRLNGYDACEKIRQQPWAAGAYIAALTGWGQEEDKSRSRAAGFDRHLVKPVEPATIEKLIQGLPIPKRP